jgi:ribonuclease HI
VRIQSTNLRTWLIFSDGACEGEQNKEGTVGAILVNPEGELVQYFAEKVPASLMDKLLSQSSHPIFELELLPVGCAMSLWGQQMRHSQCVVYLDNEAAKGALSHAATNTEHGQRIIERFVKEEMLYQIKMWFARVPTSSNLADKPSRLETSELDALGVERTTINWYEVEAQLMEGTGSDEWGFKNGILVHSPTLP